MLLHSARHLAASNPVYDPTAQYDDSPEALADALDALLEDPEFLDAVADEVLFTEYENNLESANEQLDALRNQLLTDEIKKSGGK